mmetsp:Transcript_11993/g.37343  ORF Transcript_11993/g.37343 Transcript_11993/m.37343 type:complete len:260 (-) Transcript_11993:430-1209(-)
MNASNHSTTAAGQLAPATAEDSSFAKGSCKGVQVSAAATQAIAMDRKSADSSAPRPTWVRNPDNNRLTDASFSDVATASTKTLSAGGGIAYSPQPPSTSNLRIFPRLDRVGRSQKHTRCDSCDDAAARAVIALGIARAGRLDGPRGRLARRSVSYATLRARRMLRAGGFRFTSHWLDCSGACRARLRRNRGVGAGRTRTRLAVSRVACWGSRKVRMKVRFHLMAPFQFTFMNKGAARDFVELALGCSSECGQALGTRCV